MSDLVSDVTPNDSEALGVYEPEQELTDEQEQENLEERQTITSMVPILKELFNWFDEVIEGADSVSTAVQNAKQYDLTIEQAVAAHHLVASLLETKKEELAARFENYTQAESDNDEELEDG